MATATGAQKVECINPGTGGRMNIDKTTYDLFSKAIYSTLKKGGPLTFTALVEAIEDGFKKQKTPFDGSVSWYAITIKKDMEARGIIEVVKEKGKSLNGLKKPEQ